MAALSQKGYSESFRTRDGYIEAVFSKRHYQPEDLKIVDTYRFEGMSAPGDSTALFAIRAHDGTLGTLTLTYGADSNHDVELIKRIRKSI